LGKGSFSNSKEVPFSILGEAIPRVWGKKVSLTERSYI
jgi:hypothetical protein